MKTETIEIKIITPSKGKWLYDGKTISDKVINPREGAWREITEAEKIDIEEKQANSEVPVQYE